MRSEHDQGYYMGLVSAYKQIKAHKARLLERLAGKSKKLVDDVDFSTAVLLSSIKRQIPKDMQKTLENENE